MTESAGLEALAHGAILSSFTRTNRLLGPIAPGHRRPIEMTAGDPKEAMPGFVADKLSEARALRRSSPAWQASMMSRTLTPRPARASARSRISRSVSAVSACERGL